MASRKRTETTIPIEWLPAPLKQYLLQRSTTGNTVTAIPIEIQAVVAALKDGRREAVERSLQTWLARLDDNADATVLTTRTQQIMKRARWVRMWIGDEEFRDLTLDEALNLGTVRRYVQFPRNHRQKSKAAAKKRGENTRAATQRRDDKIRQAATAYRRTCPYDRADEPTSKLARHIARKLGGSRFTIRRRLTHLNLR